MPEIASVLVRASAETEELISDDTRLRVRGVMVDKDAVLPAREGPVDLETVTPVVLEHEDRNLLPGGEYRLDCSQRDLAHKADLLAVAAPQGLRVLEAGPLRRFTVRRVRVLWIGARVRVVMEAAGQFVKGIRSCGWAWTRFKVSGG
ncbi:hypothetical protein ACFWP2_35155 [Kitasatospora sp. NPDC058444]|uniref:hypothetical protein n=1 Tax=Kitasatospora sp. NPDC058444 TaxID=3346504 RepID=UPI00364C9282